MIDRLLPSGVADRVRSLSPRHRRWRALLASLSLRPDDVHPGRDELGERDFVVCGCPRTGTSLAAAQLFQPPQILTVMEPWDGLRLRPPELFASLRDELAQGCLQRGRLDVEALMNEGRVAWTHGGEKPVPVTVSDDHHLGVKWPTYWQYLERLESTRFIVCLRHPVEVVASFARQPGRLAQGLQYDVPFNRALNARLEAETDDPVERRALQYAIIHEGLLPHLDRPNVFVLRYERWFEEPHELIEDLGRFLGLRLELGPARIRRPERPVALSHRDLSAVRRHCQPVAERLGYVLDDRNVATT